MKRSVLLAVLTAAVLVAAPLQAQRGGVGSHAGGSGTGGGHGPGVGGRPGSPNGSFPHYGRYRHFRNYGWGAWGYPYSDDYWDDGGPFDFYPDTGTNVTSPPMTASPVIVVQSHDYRPPAPPPEGPKVIEASQTKGTTTASKPEPATLFVFTDGERLEARRYMLTANSLRVEIGRQQRRISLGEIDVDATVAANRERGIDIKIPTDRNEIFLGF